MKKVIAEEGGIKKICNKSHTPQNNDSEREIKIIKTINPRRMKATNMPEQLWYFAIIHHAELISRTPRYIYPNLKVRLPKEVI